MELYTPHMHQSELTQWLLQWDLPSTLLADLPPTGLIEPGAGAVFIYLTNGPVAFLEMLVVNRQLSSDERYRVIDALTLAALDLAKQAGHKRAVFSTLLPSVAQHAVELGFHQHGKTYTILDRTL